MSVQAPQSHAAVEIETQRPVVLDEIAKFQDRLFLPILNELAGEAERRLVRGLRDERLALRHRSASKSRNLQRIFVIGVPVHMFSVLHDPPPYAFAAAARAAHNGARADYRPDCATG